MKLNDVYYHPYEKFIWIRPKLSSYSNSYIRLSDNTESGFDNSSIFKERLIFVTNSTAPSFTELCKTYPELLI